MNTWPFDPLTPLSYDVIVCDPPWPFDLYSKRGNRKSAAAHYDLMSIEDIAALPVADLAQRHCLMLMWVTAPRLVDSLKVMAAWGFAYKTNLVWRKTTPAGRVRMGTGYWARSMHESVLIGTMGRPRKFSAFPSLFDGIAREHSRKPEEFYDLVNRHTAGLRRADLFSRQSRPGFDGWGFEATKFDEVANG
ncbi:MT-A70 family methyltransferase [Pelagibacterium sp. H642]|uniref:MT-A70 family methyltransferase n=1 Tax=Pelagibacterium sp. H642 TaxID=1881069 RepID=UPI0028167A03|nr:MT-A70 family methyltransferase [Pelagibacterium sp. H642]WMT90126.1 MT-A70 family methyltransferase [Pelagibacterium sp. H642]